MGTMIRRSLARIAILMAALAGPLAHAQVTCAGFEVLDVILPGGGTIGIGGYVPDTAIVDVAPGTKVDLGIYCEGTFAFPPPTIAGATYAWNTPGATTQRIEVTAPASGVSAVHSVVVYGTKSLGLSLRGAPAGFPICSVMAPDVQTIKPGVDFTVEAVCSPAADTFAWDVRSFTGKMEIRSGGTTATPTLRITNAQTSEVLPIYLIAKRGAITGPYASALVTVGNPDAPVTTASLGAGTQHTCGNTTTGGAKCWGDNAWGQLGAGRGSVGSTTAPLNVIGNANNTASVTSGSLHGCARTLQGSARCWGDNSRGQLGDNNAAFSTFGVNVVNLGTVNSVSSGPGSLHTCAVTTSGTVKCWGANENGQLGNGVVADARTAVDATAFGSGIAKVATGFGHTCVLTTLGAVRCLGNNLFGQLGDGTTASRLTAATVSGLTSGAVDMALGALHSCALLSSGAVRCWGRNSAGEIGNGVAGPNVTTPANVTGLSGVAQISAGEAHSCAVTTTGAARCWGRNAEGQLGDGTLANRTTPVGVIDLASGAKAVAAGGFHSCALLAGDTVACWGRNLSGQLGDGTYAFKVRPSPVASAANLNGQLDANNWYLRLDPLGAGTVPAALVPKALAQAFKSGTGALTATVRYKVADAGKVLDNYVVAFVPPEFLAEVKTAPGTPGLAAQRAKAKATGGLVFVQLTPDGWTNVNNELIAFTRSTTGAASGALNILDKTPIATLPPGTRFCVGYGEGSGGALGGQTFVEVQNVEGAVTQADGRPCVLSGVYLHGLRSSTLGTEVTFGATIVGTSPSGTVQFKDNGANLRDPVLVAIEGEQSVARASIKAALPAGVHGIGADYSGDSQNTWAQGVDVVPLVHTVSVAASVAVRGDASSVAGRETRFVATITGNNPAGTVQFRDNGSDFGTAQQVRDGSAVLATSALAVGGHAITAVYSGDGVNSGATSSPWDHRVETAIATTVSLASNPSPSLAGSNVTFTATVSGSSPGGTVRFRDGDAVLGQSPLSGGIATLGNAALAAGLHAISADYLGDGLNAPATATAYHQVDLPQRAASATALTASPNPSALLQSAVFTATVTGTPAPSGGTVTFRANAEPIAGCSARPLSGSNAACATTSLPAGAHVVTATYAGDTGLEESTSLALKQTVVMGTQLLAANPATLDFGGQSMNTQSLARSTILTNTSGAPLAVTLAAPTGFAVTHTCATLEPAASCTANVTFTPGAPGALNNLLAVTYAGGGPTAVALRGVGERTLTTHYYQSILRRIPDAGGKSFWEGEAVRVSGLGASINETWYAMAQAFYFSAEYAAFNRNTTGFVTDLYTTFFNRAPDSGGLAYWVGQIDSGMPREVALAAFMFSPEFASFTQAIFGNTTARAEVNTVVDFYRGFMSRLADSGGFAFWLGRFRAAQCQGAAAVTGEVEAISSAFALSGEYAARARSDSQYVGDLYNAFLRRGGDLAGVQFWIGQVASGAQTREQVRVAFKNSPEFQARVQAIIQQGCQP